MWFKIFISVIVMSVVTSVTAQSELLIKSLIEKESGGDDRAFNEKENAIGCLQIRPGYFQDAQEWDSSLKGFTHEDCYDRDVAIRVLMAYMGRYAKGATDEVIAARHNGGPKGEKKKAAQAYARDVKVIMKNGGTKPTPSKGKKGKK